MDKLLVCYPFAHPNVRLVEGFSVYDGVLRDQLDTPHRGIDYVLKEGESHCSFDVYATHPGVAYQGVSNSWGNFVLVYFTMPNGRRYRTVYSHLDDIPDFIPAHTIEQDGKHVLNLCIVHICAGEKVGRSGISGWTHGLVQLHFELQDVTDMSEDEKERKPVKLDPYGVNDRASSGRYPQPGDGLSRLDHAWITDFPPLAPG